MKSIFYTLTRILLALAVALGFALSAFAQEEPSPEGVSFSITCDTENEVIVVTLSGVPPSITFDVVVETALIFGEEFYLSDGLTSVIPFAAFATPNEGTGTTVNAGDTVYAKTSDLGGFDLSGSDVAAVNCDGGAMTSCMLMDGRVNVNDCAAPVVIYQGSIDVYGVDPNTSDAELDLRISDETIAEVGVPAENTLLGSGTNSASGQPISVYRLTSGEFQLNTFYADGKPYIIVWSEDGSFYYLAR